MLPILIDRICLPNLVLFNTKLIPVRQLSFYTAKLKFTPYSKTPDNYC